MTIVLNGTTGIDTPGLTNSGSQTISSGTANGVAYLNGSKVLTTGSALQFDGSNLGLGVTPSAWSASYKALEMGTGTSLMSYTGATPGFELNSNSYFNGTNYIYKINGRAGQYVINNGVHSWDVSASGTAGNAISFTQAMTLDASGNLGVGITSPERKLHVFSSTAAEVCTLESTVLNSDNVQLRFKGKSGERWAIGNNVATGGTGVNFDFYDLVSSALRARIDSSGNLLLKATSRPAGVNGVFYTPDSISAPRYQGFNNSTWSSGFNIYWTGSAAQLWIDSSNIGNISVTSDYRIKKNIETQATPALERVAKLRPVTYEYADYGTLFKADGVAREGFIAHELQEVIPSAVEGEKDAPDQIQSLKLDALCSVLVKAIQEQQTIITALTARIEALEAK